MNIIRETKWALLELFPEQKEAEAAAEETAWNNARSAEAAALAEAEAKEREAAEAAAESGEDQAEGEPSPGEAGTASAGHDGEDEADEAAVEEAGPEPPQSYDPEVHDLPFSEIPEGDRPNGVMVLDYSARGVHLDVQCTPQQVVDTARLLDEAGFCLEAISGVDWMKEEQLEVIYDYNRTDGQLCRVAVRVRLPRSEPGVPTISDIYPGANWHERETHEFFGIKFEGHPYLVPLLLPEDADFHPLLKDFTP